MLLLTVYLWKRLLDDHCVYDSYTVAKKMNIDNSDDFCLFIPPTETRQAVCMQETKKIKDYPIGNKDPVQFKHRLRSLTLVMLDASRKSVVCVRARVW